MTLLLPDADGVADHVERCLPGAPIVRYGEVDDAGLADVTFYCLPYMGDDASVASVARLPRLRVLQSLSSGVDDVLGAVPPGVTLCNGRGLHHEEGTAELAVTLMLASLRQLPLFVRQQSRRSLAARPHREYRGQAGPACRVRRDRRRHRAAAEPVRRHRDPGIAQRPRGRGAVLPTGRARGRRPTSWWSASRWRKARAGWSTRRSWRRCPQGRSWSMSRAGLSSTRSP